MITVNILINDKPIYTRTAVNISDTDKQPQLYKLDSGNLIKHNQNDGAVALAKKMLDDIHEV